MLAMNVYCLLVLAVSSHVAYVGAADCFSDMDNCLQDLRGLMTSEDAFWFGTDYRDRCYDEGKVVDTNECLNPSMGLSVLQRFLNTTDDTTALSQTLQMADVVYNAPAGMYYGCGQEIFVPAVYDHRLNPLEITEVSAWSLEFAPSVTWEPKDDKTMYTVLAWDVGYFFLHGFYINAMGGRVDSATPIFPYGGPRNPHPTANLFLFAIIEQTGYVDPTTVGMTLGALVAANEFRFYPTQLLAALPNTWTVPVAVNLLSVRGDTYSVEWQKKRYIVNYCPLLLSQDPAIHTVLREAEIPVRWSYEVSNGSPRGPLYTEKEPYLHDLTVDLNVEYSSDKLTIESCCVKSTYMDNMYRVSPYKSSVPVVTRDEPRVEITPTDIMNWNARPTDRHYTLMMVDMTDAAYQKAEKNYNIHWLVTDIKDADVKTGNVVLSYAGPNPFDRYTARVYVFLLFEQSKSDVDVDIRKYVSDECPDFLTNRCGGDVRGMVEDLDMELAGVNWFGVVQDDYARKMIYERFVVQPMVNVCDGLPGFEEPCPRHQTCTADASALVPSLGVLFLVAVSMLSKLF